MPAKLYVYETLLEQLAQDLEHMPTKLGPFIQEEDAVVSQRHVTRHRHLAPADQPDSREGVMGGATRARRHQRGAVAHEASDTVDARRLKGFGEGHRRHGGGESLRQHRLASPRGAEQEEVRSITPASTSASQET